MFDKLLRKDPAEDEPRGPVIGPETPEQAAARVTDPTAVERLDEASPRTAGSHAATPDEATGGSSPEQGERRYTGRLDHASTAGHEGPRSQPEGRTLPRFVLVLLSLAAALVVLNQLQPLKGIIAPAFFALNLMITAYPVQRWLMRRGAPGWLAALVAGLVVVLVLAAMMFGLSYGVAAMVGELPKYTDQFTALYEQSLHLMTRFGFDQTVLLKQLKGISPSSVLNVVTGVLSNASVVASLMIVVLTTLIFMVMDAGSIEDRMAAVRRSHPSLGEGLHDFAGGIRKYWLVSTVFGLVVAVVDYGILVGLGVPLALVWAMFSFLTNYIPNIGFVIGLVPPALLALVNDSWRSALMVVLLYSVVNFVIQSIIQPRVAGDAVGLTPTLSFLSLLLWGWVFGGMGALIALPLSLLVKALLVDADPRATWANALVSSKVPDPQAPAQDPTQEGAAR